MPTLNELGERALLERLRARLPEPSKRVWIPIGDDAAASEPAPPGEALVSTVDLLAEGVDFTRETPARSVGWKSVAVNLSDLGAMGAVPRGVLIALAAPGETDVRWVDAFYDGVAACCREFDVDVLGGDLSGVAPGGGISVAVTALGDAPRDRLVKRAGALVGDLVCVTGTLGDAAAGLEKLRRGAEPDASDPLIARQIEPTPRVAAGVALAREKIAHAMIDVSDGLIADLGHLLDASGVGARIETAKLPLSSALAGCGIDPMRCALTGGEDFELLFTLSPDAEPRARGVCEEAGTTLTVIGTIIAAQGTSLVRPDGTLLPPPTRGGFDHFSR